MVISRSASRMWELLETAKFRQAGSLHRFNVELPANIATSGAVSSDQLVANAGPTNRYYLKRICSRLRFLRWLILKPRPKKPQIETDQGENDEFRHATLSAGPHRYVVIAGTCFLCCNRPGDRMLSVHSIHAGSRLDSSSCKTPWTVFLNLFFTALLACIAVLHLLEWRRAKCSMYACLDDLGCRRFRFQRFRT